MNSRAEAVTYLLSLGFQAKERDWSLGETIGVFAGVKILPEYPELQLAERGVYIYRRDGLWSIYNPRLAYPTSDERRLSLQEACDVAADILRDDHVA